MPLCLHLYSPAGAEGLLPGTIHSCQESESYHQAGSTFQCAYSAEFSSDGDVLLTLHPWVCLNSIPSFWTPQEEGQMELGKGSGGSFLQHTECPCIGSCSRASHAGAPLLGILGCFRHHPRCLPPASTAHSLGGHERDKDLQLHPKISPETCWISLHI